ncbi:MAG: hypothetical protein C4533_00800 [Candidatus Omnitrophota bacterium]|jgi:tRNA U34 2-thiouridine synthase MnmA/TrmU|nr:MAG: hypothetical protein C4533_00800 [Candidatus Omnitrophota bacterium]
MKAIGLISGGLDSILAARIMKDSGIELIALHTSSPFCLCNKRGSSGCVHSAQKAADDLGIRLININVSREIIDIVKKPKYGYGSNMNPCIDCRILLFKKAKEAMSRENASFVITGEVLGQRPMSQKRDIMKLIDRESGLEGLVLRPLSARVMEPTLAEEKGWIDRNKLLAISGRGRKEQISLARSFGVYDYPCPSGGCLLTDPQFSRRLKDLIKYGNIGLNEVNLLKVGRHFRINDKLKLVVGRNEKENQQLLNLASSPDMLFLPPDDIAGPISLARGQIDNESRDFCCRIVSRYYDNHDSGPVKVVYKYFGDSQGKECIISPAVDKEIQDMKV